MRKLKNILLLSSILIITAAFNFKDNPPSGWYQQFLPNINGQSISDMLFLDSLNGFLITESASISDTSYILKTTNGGDNWEIKFRAVDDFSTIKFANNTTGFMCGGDLYKTTDAGENWFVINAPNQTRMEDIELLNSDTMWVVDNDGLTGGVFRTTNGGSSWVQQLTLSINPSYIYFYNARIGFICNNAGSYIRKTTDGGATWNIVVSGESFTDIHFVDSLTGWRASSGGIKKTSNGGLNWVNQQLPSHSGVVNFTNFSNVNKDTIWGVGGKYDYPGNRTRAVLYTTTNGGSNWFFQVPDTSIEIFQYTNIQFTDKSKGWAYAYNKGIHTKVGGDPLTSVNPIFSETPKQFKLEQNYPNPFNPTTQINYELQIANYVTLKVYDLQGKEIQTLVNKKQSAGNYSVEFNGANLSSGIYFYTLQTENYKETKKMMLVK